MQSIRGLAKHRAFGAGQKLFRAKMASLAGAAGAEDKLLFYTGGYMCAHDQAAPGVAWRLAAWRAMVICRAVRRRLEQRPPLPPAAGGAWRAAGDA
jgi:hypothetical protein